MEELEKIGGVAQLGVQVGQFLVNWRISLATHLNRIPENGRIGKNWGRSSAGRAFGSHPRGRGFESLRLHQCMPDLLLSESGIHFALGFPWDANRMVDFYFCC